VSHLKTCTVVDATPGSPRCRDRPLGPGATATPAAATQAVQLLPSWSHFQTRWSLHHCSRSSQESPRKPLPRGEVFECPGPQLIRSLHKGGTHSASGNRLQGLTSDLVHSSSEASAQGGALWRLPTPLVRGQTRHGNSTFYSITVVHCVKSLYINRYVYSSKPVLSCYLLIHKIVPNWLTMIFCSLFPVPTA
jgi:hypothetical protein